MDSIVTDFDIRDCTEADIPAILNIDKMWAGPNPILEDRVKAMLADDKCSFLVATFKGEVVGFAGGVVRDSEFGEKDPIGYITHVGLNKEFSQKGMGKMLGDRLVDELEHQSSKIRTVLSFERADLQAFFNNLGFKRTDFLVYEYHE